MGGIRAEAEREKPRMCEMVRCKERRPFVRCVAVAVGGEARQAKDDRIRDGTDKENEGSECSSNTCRKWRGRPDHTHMPNCPQTF